MLIPTRHDLTRPRSRRGLIGRWVLGVLITAIPLGTVLVSGCAPGAQPVRDSREALGTFVTITAYGTDTKAIEGAVDHAFNAIAKSEAVLSAYPDEAADPAAPPYQRTLEVSSVAQFNRDPYQWHGLPAAIAAALGRVEALGVGEYFLPTMLRVVGLYDFEGSGSVPDEAELERLVRAAHAFETSATPAGVAARFEATDTLLAPSTPPSSSFAPPAVGLDLSGAAKGAALDAAWQAMRESAGEDAIEGALLSAGSTTLVVGEKRADGRIEPWRVGIEDPRAPERVIGIVEFRPTQEASGGALPLGTVSTSGDYQQSFVRDGVRYHHILDPSTGKPARGMRSLTVVGAVTGVDSDILSTALFVMGPERAEAYARAHGLGLFIVDAEGRTRIVPGPAGATYSIRLGRE